MAMQEGNAFGIQWSVNLDDALADRSETPRRSRWTMEFKRLMRRWDLSTSASQPQPDALQLLTRVVALIRVELPTRRPLEWYLRNLVAQRLEESTLHAKVAIVGLLTGFRAAVDINRRLSTDLDDDDNRTTGRLSPLLASWPVDEETVIEPPTSPE